MQLFFAYIKLTFPSANSFEKSNGSLVIQYLHNLKLYLIPENFTCEHIIWIKIKKKIGKVVLVSKHYAMKADWQRLWR